MFKKWVLFLLALAIVSGCSDEGLEGPYTVTKVIDGDTIALENSQRVRFSGINTPETGECYYQEAKDKLTGLVLGKAVFLERDRTDIDKYGRMLRYVYKDDILVNSILVEEGYGLPAVDGNMYQQIEPIMREVCPSLNNQTFHEAKQQRRIWDRHEGVAA